MRFEPSPQFPQKNPEARKRFSADLENMSPDQLLEYRKGLEWHVKNMPNPHAQQEELRRVDQILENRERPTMH